MRSFEWQQLAQARRRDLALLRALGSNGRQLRAIIHWQATVTTAFMLLVGLPCGVVVGRWIIALVTSALGIVPGADAPALLLLAIAGLAVITANLVALVPARQAARANVGQLLRD